MRVAFALRPEVAAPLAAECARWGHDVVAVVEHQREFASLLLDAEVELAIVSASPSMLTAEVLALCDARGVRLVAAVEDDAERRHAVGLGLFELVELPSDWSGFEHAASGPTRSRTPAAPAGRVIAVWGPAGAPGRTSTAIGIAAELALAGYSVALADVDTYGASVAPALGLLDEAPGFAAACRLAGSGSLDVRELERIGQYHRLSSTSGMWVLTGIGRSSRWPELSSKRVAGVIEACRKWADVTVLDTSFSVESDEEISSDLFAPRRNGATIAALRNSDGVVAVGAADPVGMSRLLRAHADLLGVCEDVPVDVVMNKVRSSAVGMSPARQVSRTLARFGGIDAAALIPWDQAGFDAAVLSGATLAQVAPRSPARLALQRYVTASLVPDLLPVTAAP